MSCSCGWKNCNCNKTYTKAAINGYGALTKSQVDRLLDPISMREWLKHHERKTKMKNGKLMSGRGFAIPKQFQGLMETKFVKDLIEEKRKKIKKLR